MLLQTNPNAQYGKNQILHIIWTHKTTSRQKCLLGKDDAARSYRVRLYFANVDDKDTGPFDVKLQGQVVASAVNIPTANAGPVKPTIKEFEGVQVTDNLLVELVADSNTTAVLSAIEVTSEK